MSYSKGNSLMFDIIEKMEYMVRVMDDDNNIIYMNQKMRREFGDHTSKKCFELLCEEGKCSHCVSQGCKKSYHAETKDVSIHGKTYRIMASPVSLDKKEKFSVEIFEDVTAQRKIAEENLRHYEKLKEDIEFAKQIQIRALPIDDEYWDSLRVSSSYQPSEALGGDIFDVVKIDDDRTLFYIADVCGHGIRSSLLTIFLRQVIRGMKTEAGELGNIITELLSDYNSLHMKNEQYFSILAGVYEKSARKVSFVNAGHNCLPFVMRKSGESFEISIHGMPICELVDESSYEQTSIKVVSGDRIFLYTDGITEAYSKDKDAYFGLAGLQQVIFENPQADGKTIAKKINKAACDFGNQKAADDMAVVVIEIL